MTDLEALTARWRAAVAESSDGQPRPTRQHNRLMTRAHTLGEELAASAEGRNLLEHTAVSDPDPLLRFTAAAFLAAWDEVAARGVFEALVRDGGGQVVRPMTMSAALAVPGSLRSAGSFAALRLMDLDSGPRRPPVRPALGQAGTGIALGDARFVAARNVTDLALNGGLDHAYELVGDTFAAVASTCDDIGASEAGRILRALLDLVRGTGTGATLEERAAQLAGLGDDDGDRLDDLVARFDDAVDTLDQQLDAVE